MDAILFQSIESSSYLNKKTGEIVIITDEDFEAAENQEPPNDYPEWQRDSIRKAKEIQDNEKDFINLPTKFDIHEYRIMEKFCLSLENEEISGILHNAIKGKGAFRRFKDGIHRFEIKDKWHKYQEEAIRQIAIDWCTANDIEPIEE